MRSSWLGVENVNLFEDDMEENWILPRADGPAFQEAREILSKIGQTAVESAVLLLAFELMEEWCDEHCADSWILDKMSLCYFGFYSQQDALLFKLTHG